VYILFIFNLLVILLNYLDTTPQAKCRFNTYRV